MTDCIVHIGTHKTGSTSIQESFSGYENDSFFYASIGNSPNHSLPMYSLFAPDPSRHHLHRTAQREGARLHTYIQDASADLERSVSAARGRTVIISGEDMSVLPQRSVRLLRDRLRAHFSKVTIAGYVRPPAGYMASSFQQRIKSGNMLSFDIPSLYRSYEKSFAKYDELFGQDNVQLWLFDPKTFPEHCVVHDFCSHLALPLPRRIVRVNESFQRDVVSLIYIHNVARASLGLDRMTGRDSKRLAKLIGDGGGKFRLSPDLVRPVLEAQRGDIAWMEKRLGCTLVENLGEPGPGDVCREEDLLHPGRRAVDTLRQLLGASAPRSPQGETIEEVARLVERLRALERLDS